MAASWLLQVLYTSLLGGTNLNGGSGVPGTTTTDLHVLATTTYGTLRGIIDNNGQPNVIKYLGIPFAAPPTGSLRFKQPQPPKTWSGVKDATQFGAQCLQRSMPEYNDVGKAMDEDCLFLNVYTPVRNASAGQLPVMVWIHGGAYYLGSGGDYDATPIAKKEVVVVTINYRLDVIGFLSTEDDVIPGNYGMLDQVLALKWVQENIASFGGDPKRVTIFGESAGSGSVSLLVLSPLAKGLFQRAIMQSGTSLSPWSVVHRATRMSPTIVARLIGAQAGCTQKISDQFLLCMQTVDGMKLTNIATDIFNTVDSGILMVPRVENSFGFLPDLPIKLLSNGQYNHVDTIRGYVSHEMGLLFANRTSGVSKTQFTKEVKIILAPYSITDASSLIQLIHDTYIANIEDPMVIVQKLTDFNSDFAFVGPTINEVQLAAKTSPEKSHFVYEFNYRPSYSTMLPAWIKVIHGQDVSFTFGLEPTSLLSGKNQPSSDDRLVSEQMMTLWTNFARTGKPTCSLPMGAVPWEPFTNTNQNILKISNASLSVRYEHPKVTDMYSKILQKLDTEMSSSADIIG